MSFAFINRILQRSPTNRVCTPTLLQIEATECGAAALGIILGYYDRIVPLAELRRECGISRDGSNAMNIVKAARNYGLNAKGFKKALSSLNNLPPPYIVFWNFNHFLVVEGFGKNCVYLNDPATGRRTISLEELDRAYTGVVLAMEAGPNFQKGGKKSDIISALADRLKNSRGSILFCLLAGLLLTVPRLAVPGFTQVFIDEILINDRRDWIRPLVLGIVLTGILRALLARLRLTYLRKLMLKLSVTMSGQFLWHILRLPVGFYAQRFSGEISSRVSLNDKIADILSGRLATTVIDSLMMVFYFLIMLQYDWVLSVIASSFAALNFFALQYLSRTRVDANMKLAAEYGKVNGVAIALLQNIETVKASGLESDSFAKFAGYYAKALNAQQELALQTQILTILPTVLTAITTASILIVGGFRVMNGSFSIGMLVAYQSLTASFLGPVNSLVNFGSLLQDLEADLNRLDDVLQNSVDAEVERSGRGEDLERVGVGEGGDKGNFFPLSPLPLRLYGEIELQNITFGYSRLNNALIENFSLTLKPGQRVAIVGGSGSGKSTIAKLVCGLYEPWLGEIYFDGIPRTQIPRSVLANSLAMVEQDIFLFAGTIRENLTLWDSTVPQADLVQACRDAAIHDLIVSLPGGYDAVLIEGGMNISGGQRQRLEIARAMVRNPSILVMDEATSALDAQTELIIDQNLRQRGCSCIVVAHRLSTIRDSDEIIVLELGKVVQRGTHEELWHSGGKYASLLRTEE